MSKKVLISGYYGFNNFGDEAILKVLIDNLKNIGLQTCVITSNPSFTKQIYPCIKTCYTFDFISIIRQMIKTDILISGGGSLLQDTTSLKSLFYYLFIIILARFFQKQIIIFAQGIGPIKNPIARFITKKVLQKCNFISVRDERSLFLLRSWGLSPQLVCDPVYSMNLQSNIEMNRVGIQLRSWSDLSESFLYELAKCVNKYFSHKEIYIYSFQDDLDVTACQAFITHLNNINSSIKTKLVYNQNVKQIISSVRNLDYMVAMRFHACLLSVKYGIRTLGLSYDIKVQKLSQDIGFPCVELFQEENLDKAFKQMTLLDKRELIAKVNNIKFDFNKIIDAIK